jgi:hypothetical protein
VKVFEYVLAIVFGVAGLAMSTCGLFFSVAGLGNAYGILVISIPVSLVGFGVLWLAWVLWKSARAKIAPPADPAGGKPRA